MTRHARQVSRLRPAAIAIHDNGDMSWDAGHIQLRLVCRLVILVKQEQPSISALFLIATLFILPEI
jgi:hypothetical protein